MHNSFREGFEKQAFLQDLWKGKEHLLDKATMLKAMNRVKNTPSVTFSEMRTRDVAKDIYNSSKNKTSLKGSTAFFGQPAATDFSKKINVLPADSKLLSVANTGLWGKDAKKMGPLIQQPQSRANVIHHELDEASLMTPGAKPTMQYGTAAYGFSHGEENLNKLHSVADAVKQRDWGKLKSSVKSVVDESSKLKQMGKLPQASHMGPEVLINESNRTFHEMGPEQRSALMDLRKNNEGELLKRHGLRYGDEYVQPGTRRYNRLVANMNKTLADAGGDTTKLFPPKRKGPPNA